ncbi:MAG: hypothetical protein DRJ07_05510 [Bacteroidetes bacterium]|nr:MAG: hypothetical protein DRJ07_05510 [Bacteroidota bacterium]
MVMGQEKYLSQIIKDCNTTKSTSIQNNIFVTYNLNNESVIDEMEPSGEIENWMYDINLWVKDQIEDEAEAEIENWMLNTDLWNNDLSENELDIENWMLNSNLWKESAFTQNHQENQLKIESWMSATDYWGKVISN